jgi:hypothetical protein
MLSAGALFISRITYRTPLGGPWSVIQGPHRHAAIAPLQSPNTLSPASSGAFFGVFIPCNPNHIRQSPFSPMPYRRGRIIDTGALRASQVLKVSSDDQQREQGSEDNNPNVNAHQSRPAAALRVNNAILF